MLILACMVVEKYFSKCHSSKYRRKENWTNTGKNKQEKACSQTHETKQKVVINMYTTYDHSSLHGCGEIFDEIFHQIGD